MRVSVDGDRFYIDGAPTYHDFEGVRPEALGRLMNTRMVQATFEDENPDTVDLFRYPDGSPFDPDRQTDELIAELSSYRRHGVLGITVNLQGGFPLYHERLSGDQYLQEWDNNGFTPDGALKDRYAERLRRVIAGADERKMAVIVGYFYFGQNHKLADEAAVRQAVTEASEFLAGLQHDNVIIEVNNECDLSYVHEVLQPHRVHELIELTRSVSEGRFLVTTSFRGGSVPTDAVLEAGDLALLHGNNQEPDGIRAMVDATRAKTGKPIVFNEDSVRIDNLRAAWESGASWGYYDQGHEGAYEDGFQSPPTNWTINTHEKRAFFETVAELVGIGSEASSTTTKEQHA